MNSGLHLGIAQLHPSAASWSTTTQPGSGLGGGNSGGTGPCHSRLTCVQQQRQSGGAHCSTSAAIGFGHCRRAVEPFPV